MLLCRRFANVTNDVAALFMAMTMWDANLFSRISVY